MIILPFEAHLGWNLTSPLDLLTGNKDSNESIIELKERFKSTLDNTKYAYILVKAHQSAILSLKLKTHTYKSRDKAWINKSLFRDAYSRSQESDKLISI